MCIFPSLSVKKCVEIKWYQKNGSSSNKITAGQTCYHKLGNCSKFSESTGTFRKHISQLRNSKFSESTRTFWKRFLFQKKKNTCVKQREKWPNWSTLKYFTSVLIMDMSVQKLYWPTSLNWNVDDIYQCTCSQMPRMMYF